jgi:serine/threonine protein kinase
MMAFCIQPLRIAFMTPAEPQEPSSSPSFEPPPFDPEATRFGPPPAAGPADPDATHYTAANPASSRGAEASHAGGRPVLPRRFGDYELLERIASGGMGVVYKARHRTLHRLVALKTIHAGALATPAAVERFLTEARATARLEHPGIVPIYDIGEEDGQSYFTMQLIAGGTLQERVGRGPLPPQEAAGLLRQVAEAVQFAHEHGIVHRDLKPHNILLNQEAPNRPGSSEGLALPSTLPPPGRPASSAGSPVAGSSSAHRPAGTASWVPKVADFGLARVQDEGGGTFSGEVLGTPSYMPPEQAIGDLKRVGPRSDVYSLGAVLYCLLTGRPPFQSAAPGARASRAAQPGRAARCGDDLP